MPPYRSHHSKCIFKHHATNSVHRPRSPIKWHFLLPPTHRCLKTLLLPVCCRPQPLSPLLQPFFTNAPPCFTPAASVSRAERQPPSHCLQQIALAAAALLTTSLPQLGAPVLPVEAFKQTSTSCFSTSIFQTTSLAFAANIRVRFWGCSGLLAALQASAASWRAGTRPASLCCGAAPQRTSCPHSAPSPRFTYQKLRLSCGLLTKMPCFGHAKQPLHQLPQLLLPPLTLMQLPPQPQPPPHLPPVPVPGARSLNALVAYTPYCVASLHQAKQCSSVMMDGLPIVHATCSYSG
jgi:hypothetical protein